MDCNRVTINYVGVGAPGDIYLPGVNQVQSSAALLGLESSSRLSHQALKNSRTKTAQECVIPILNAALSCIQYGYNEDTYGTSGGAVRSPEVPAQRRRHEENIAIAPRQSGCQSRFSQK